VQLQFIDFAQDLNVPLLKPGPLMDLVNLVCSYTIQMKLNPD